MYIYTIYEVTMTEDVNLGEKITLTGFSDEDTATMVAVKKIVGNGVKKLMDEHEDFRHLSITLKKVHAHADGKGGKNEIHLKLDLGKIYTTEVVDFNLFAGLDAAFKKVSLESQKH